MVAKRVAAMLWAVTMSCACCGIFATEAASGMDCTSTVYQDQLALRVVRMVNPSDEEVLRLLETAVSPEHVGEYSIAQVCDVFDYLDERWEYVPDRSNLGDTLTPPWITLLTMQGDCEDFAVVLASAILSLGGCAEIGLEADEASGHACARLFVGDDWDAVVQLRAYLRFRYRTAHVFVSEDDEGHHWIRLDSYPGDSFWWRQGRTIITCKRVIFDVPPSKQTTPLVPELGE